MQGWQRGIRRLDDLLSGGFEALGPVVSEIDEVLSAGVLDNFDRQVDHQGVPWAPRKDNLPHPLLIKTGRMMTAAGGGTGHKFEVSGERATFGIYETAVSYAIFHHMGTSRMARRRVVYASAQTQRVVLGVVRSGFRLALLRIGFMP
jgi:hypothetical protein